MSPLVGSFLVAGPLLESPRFGQSVILLLQHREAGAFGLVVNRRGPDRGLPFPVFSGGPCKAEGFLLLHNHPEWTSSPEKQVAPGIFVGDFACFKRVSEAAPGHGFRFRAFTGYACWDPGQLERELAAGLWRVQPASGGVLFETPVEDLWDRLSPPRIPRPSMN
jgi:putative transcriptional regulator